MSNLWKVVIAILVTVIIVGGGGYYYMNNKAIKEKNDLQAMIDDLNARVDNLSAATGSVATTGAVATTGTTTGATSTATLSYEQICKDLYPNAAYGSMDGKKAGTNVCSVTNVVGKYAKGGVGTVVDEGGGPGAYWIAINQNSKWTSILTGQDVPLCSTLNQYNVPAVIAGDECVTQFGEGGQIVKYPN